VLSATAGNATVALSWTVPADGGSPITAYRVYRGTTPGGEAALPVATLGASTTSYADNGLANGTTYFYVVAAVNAVSETRSIERTATPQAPPPVVAAPGAPQRLAASRASSTRIRLSWSPPVTGGSVSGYRIYRGTSSTGAKSLIATVGTSTSSYNNSASRRVTYYYVVVAYNGSGPGPASNQVSFRLP
jgi:titin